MTDLPTPGIYWLAFDGYRGEIHTYTAEIRADGTALSSGIVWTDTWTRQMQTYDRLHATEAEAVRVCKQYLALKVA